jgi:hypothetical protein
MQRLLPSECIVVNVKSQTGLIFSSLPVGKFDTKVSGQVKTAGPDYLLATL